MLFVNFIKQLCFEKCLHNLSCVVGGWCERLTWSEEMI